VIHELKQLPCYFEDVISGKKTFEIRKADRPYQIGDLLALNEYDAKKDEYTGNSCLVVIDYILNDNEYCKEGYVVMSIKPRWIGKSTGGDYSVPYATKKE
jgi:hypothetical protein